MAEGSELITAAELAHRKAVMAVAEAIVDTLEDVHSRMTAAGSTMGEAHAFVAEVLGATVSMNAANLALVEDDVSAFDAVIMATDAARDAWSPLWHEQCQKQLAGGQMTGEVKR